MSAILLCQCHYFFRNHKDAGINEDIQKDGDISIHIKKLYVMIISEFMLRYIDLPIESVSQFQEDSLADYVSSQSEKSHRLSTRLSSERQSRTATSTIGMSPEKHSEYKVKKFRKNKLLTYSESLLIASLCYQFASIMQQQHTLLTCQYFLLSFQFYLLTYALKHMHDESFQSIGGNSLKARIPLKNSVNTFPCNDINFHNLEPLKEMLYLLFEENNSETQINSPEVKPCLDLKSRLDVFLTSLPTHLTSPLSLLFQLPKYKTNKLYFLMNSKMENRSSLDNTHDNGVNTGDDLTKYRGSSTSRNLESVNSKTHKNDSLMNLTSLNVRSKLRTSSTERLLTPLKQSLANVDYKPSDYDCRNDLTSTATECLENKDEYHLHYEVSVISKLSSMDIHEKLKLKSILFSLDRWDHVSKHADSLPPINSSRMVNEPEKLINAKEFQNSRTGLSQFNLNAEQKVDDFKLPSIHSSLQMNQAQSAGNTTGEYTESKVDKIRSDNNFSSRKDLDIGNEDDYVIKELYIHTAPSLLSYHNDPYQYSNIISSSYSTQTGAFEDLMPRANSVYTSSSDRYITHQPLVSSIEDSKQLLITLNDAKHNQLQNTSIKLNTTGSTISTVEFAATGLESVSASMTPKRNSAGIEAFKGDEIYDNTLTMGSNFITSNYTGSNYDDIIFNIKFIENPASEDWVNWISNIQLTSICFDEKEISNLTDIRDCYIASINRYTNKSS